MCMALTRQRPLYSALPERLIHLTVILINALRVGVLKWSSFLNDFIFFGFYLLTYIFPNKVWVYRVAHMSRCIIRVLCCLSQCKQ